MKAIRTRKLTEAGYSERDAAAVVASGTDAYKRALLAPRFLKDAGIRTMQSARALAAGNKAAASPQSQGAADRDKNDLKRYLSSLDMIGAGQIASGRYAVGEPTASRTKLSQAALLRIAKAFRQT